MQFCGCPTRCNAKNWCFCCYNKQRCIFCITVHVIQNNYRIAYNTAQFLERGGSEIIVCLLVFYYFYCVLFIYRIYYVLFYLYDIKCCHISFLDLYFSHCVELAKWNLYVPSLTQPRKNPRRVHITTRCTSKTVMDTITASVHYYCPPPSLICFVQ